MFPPLACPEETWQILLLAFKTPCWISTHKTPFLFIISKNVRRNHSNIFFFQLLARHQRHQEHCRLKSKPSLFYPEAQRVAGNQCFLAVSLVPRMWGLALSVLCFISLQGLMFKINDLCSYIQLKYHFSFNPHRLFFLSLLLVWHWFFISFNSLYELWFPVCVCHVVLGLLVISEALKTHL